MMNHWRALLIVGSCMAALPAVAGEPIGAPVPGDPPRVGAPPPPAVALVADRHVPSTELGFERGIGPAAGQTVTWRGVDYVVVDVAADGGRPTFSGGSRFAITTAGGSLQIGLKALEAIESRVADARR